MADVHRLPSVRTVEQEAGEWIARLNADDVTAEDHVRFNAWRRAHPLNAQAFDDLSNTWGRYLKAGSLARALACAESENPPRTSNHRYRWGLALAATAIVATLLTGLYLQGFVPEAPFKTAIGEQLTVRLADGSFMELNSNSVARVDFSPRRRIIHLDRGEAFFRVAHDARRPFWVTAGGDWVRAVGTEFDLYLRASSLQVTVREGTVQAGESRDLLSTTQPDEYKLPPWVTLTGGQQADLEAGAARKRTLSAEELADTVAWRTGMVYFENRPLAEVVAELNRYSTEQLIVEDDELRALPVGGTFQAGPKGAVALVHMLEQNVDVRVRRDGTRTYLSSSSVPTGH